MGLVGKPVHEDTSSLKEGEPSFASKADKIAHQQTLHCYCRTVTVLLFVTKSRGKRMIIVMCQVFIQYGL
jgi:hypothetical protein